MTTATFQVRDQHGDVVYQGTAINYGYGWMCTWPSTNTSPTDLDGKFLTSDYDEEADILYLWLEGPVPSVSYETSDGHLVELDPHTRELVGITIIDFRERWEGKPIRVEIPSVEPRVLETNSPSTSWTTSDPCATLPPCSTWTEHRDSTRKPRPEGSSS